MILPNLVLPSRVNQSWKFSGLDHINQCLDKKHFLSYPHNITYNYNSRGFRDQEWPDSIEALRDSIWCIGDSFTMGLGCPVEHTWPYILSTSTDSRIINVSMDGASNEWIARITEQIVHSVNPSRIVIMWSYTHRREHSNLLLNDEDRRIYSSVSGNDEDWINFLSCKQRVDLITKSVQFAIPDFHVQSSKIISHWSQYRGTDWPVEPPATLEELNALPKWILEELHHLHHCLTDMQCFLNFQPVLKNLTSVIPVCRMDLARDYHHFDLITAHWVVQHAL